MPLCMLVALADVREWVQTIVPSVNLLLILWGIIKVFNRHEMEWREKEHRLTSLEADVRAFSNYGKDLVSLKTKLDELTSEMERVRNRLDRFLDIKGVIREE